MSTEAQQSNEASMTQNCLLGEWVAYPAVRPANYGRYLVYRAGCQKMHFETWNNTGWAYNNRDITHWAEVRPPFA